MIQQFYSGYLYQENENSNLRKYMCPYLYCNIIYNNLYVEVTSVSVSR